MNPSGLRGSSTSARFVQQSPPAPETLAAFCTKGSNAQEVTFAKPGTVVFLLDVIGPFVCIGCCSQMISDMFSEVAHMYPACCSTRGSWPCWG